MAKKFGVNATVSEKFNFVKPILFWKDIFPNDYFDCFISSLLLA